MYIAIVLFIVFLIWISVAITKSWNKGAARRQIGRASCRERVSA